MADPGRAAPSSRLLDDQERQRAARRLADAAEQSRMNRLAELTARLLRGDACQVSLVDDALRIVGGSGLPAGQIGSVTPVVDSVCLLTLSAAAPVRIADTTVDRRTSGLRPVTAGEVRSYLGVPLFLGGHDLIGALCVFDFVAREWTDEEEALLTQLADSVVAEIELSALSVQYQLDRALWEVAVDAAGVGTFNLDIASGVLAWDDRMVELFGYTRDEFDNLLTDAFARIHPGDLERVSGVVDRAIAESGSYDDQYRLLLPGGRVRWIASRGRVLAGEDGTAQRLIGAAYDITSLRGMTERLESILARMSVGYLAMDGDWRLTFVNDEALALLGKTREQMLGADLWELFPGTRGTVLEQTYRRVAETREPAVVDAYYPAPFDAWYEVRAVPEGDGIAMYFLDVTARVVARRDADAARSRAELVAQLSALLSEDIEIEEALARMPGLIVPVICDWGIATILDEATDEAAGRSDRSVLARLRDVGTAHRDPASGAIVQRYSEIRLPALRSFPEGNSYVLQTARSSDIRVVRLDTTASISRTLPPGEARSLLEQLAPDAAVVVPLRGRGRTLGLITLCWNEPNAATGAGPRDRGPTEADLAVLEIIADRAGLALDSARLARQQRALAEGLQRSLLTEPPEPDHLQIAVRYLPAAEAAQVGGDWYDAFLQPSGDTMLVIGDVLGHDTAAAAAMGQIRSLVRSAAVITGAGPAEVLSQVDSAARTLRVGTYATAVVARIEQTSSEHAHGDRHVRWSNAGHPPPLLIGPDADVTVLEAARPNMLLGVEPTSERDEPTYRLPPGSSLFLYTDGLVERQDQPIDEGIERLQRVLRELAGLGLDELCDAVLDRMLDGGRSDDVAIIAVRLHPEDRPRPAEAGPVIVPDDIAERDARG